MRELGIFILCYNRPEYIDDAIQSILAQDFKNFDLIISDNSTTNSVQKVLEKYRDLPNMKIIHRVESYTPIEHFNKILSEAEPYTYFMMFHDDDLMLTGCLVKLMSAFKKDSAIAAVSCNAYNKYNPEKPRTIFNPYLKSNLLIQNPKTLISRYFTKKLSHTPFPFYVYDSKKVVALTMDFQQGGKYCDVSFLCKVAEQGPLFWIAEPLAEYRRHQNNDSNIINLADLVSLCRFIFIRYKSFYFKMGYVLLKRIITYCLLSLRQILT